MKQVLIAGASGLVGRGAIRAFAADPGCEVVAVSRRAPYGVGAVRHVPVDLFDAAACEAAFSRMSGVTHLVFTALYEKEKTLSPGPDRDAV